MLVEYLFEQVCVSVSHAHSKPGVSPVSSFWEVGRGARSHFVSVSPVQALSVLLSCRAKSFTDTHSYSLLTEPRNNKSGVS